MSSRLTLSRKHGVQPTIPLCPYCGKPKNQVVLLGMAGDRLAKAMGHADGQMPMYAKIPGDYEPCDECAQGRICVVEVKPPKNGGTVRKIIPSGVMAMISEDIVKQWLSTSPERLEQVLKARIMCIDHETAGKIGLLEAVGKAKEQPDD